MCWQSNCFELCSFCCGSPRQFPRNQSAVQVVRLSSLAGWVETVNSQSRRTSSVGHAWPTNALVTTRDNYLVHSQLRMTNNPITQPVNNIRLLTYINIMKRPGYTVTLTHSLVFHKTCYNIDLSLSKHLWKVNILFVFKMVAVYLQLTCPYFGLWRPSQWPDFGFDELF